MNEFYNQTSKSVLEHFSVTLEEGLDGHKIQNRKKLYGLNELKKKKGINPIFLFFRQFKSFIIYILLFAVIISIIAREYIDSVVILSILLFNAFFGFIQEYRAEKAIEALKKLSALKSKVIRGGKLITIDAKEIVPGDILVLEEGDKIPADARIIESINLEVLESSLTGESNPVSKNPSPLKGKVALADRKNMIFSGTAITRGRGKAVVTSVGMKTEIGKIADMISEVEEESTPLQKKLESLGKYIGMGTLIVCFIVLFSGIFKDNLFSLITDKQYLEFIFQAKNWFLTAIALAVAAVPEGLPAIVTIALALGVKRMVAKNALIRRLPSVETLGETTVICSDKTGTLTENEMTVRKAYANVKHLDVSGEGYEFDGQVTHQNKKVGDRSFLLFKIGALCNNALLREEKNDIKVIGDPTEAALLVSAHKAGLDYKKLQKEWKRIKEEPFDSMRKMMSTVNKDPVTKKSYVFTKGAPERILETCDRIIINGKITKLMDPMKEAILDKNEEFASGALRVLGFAYKEYNPGSNIEDKLIFVGLQGMIDPPRQEVKESIKRCATAGIRVIMITGDNQKTAEAISKEIGIKGASITGIEFSNLSEEEQKKSIEKISIFARVDPGHKMRIVELLQEKGNVVAMTGDGVNDAPALKKADIGVAMGIAGTDVAKESSDMVLQDDDFSSIVNSVEEGRGIYENIQKFVNYLLSSNVAEVLVIFLAILFAFPLPMTAIMLLWLNLVTDGLPALALSVDPNSKNIMKKPPKKAREGIMNRSMFFNIAYVAVLITAAVLGLFYWAMIQYEALEPSLFLQKIQTVAFTAIIVMEFARLQAIRSEYRLGPFSNKWLILAVILSLSLQLAVIYTPLSMFFGTIPLNLIDWGMIIGATLIVLVLNMIGVSIKNRIKWFKH